VLLVRGVQRGTAVRVSVAAQLVVGRAGAAGLGAAVEPSFGSGSSRTAPASLLPQPRIWI